MLVKSSALLSVTGALGRPKEEMNILEMSLNKNDVMLEKTKLCIIKLNQLYIILPFTIQKVEVKMRNVMLNSKPKFEAISRFIEFYINVYNDWKRGAETEENAAQEL